jgi:hypothetical protein
MTAIMNSSHNVYKRDKYKGDRNCLSVPPHISAQELLNEM